MRFAVVFIDSATVIASYGQKSVCFFDVYEVSIGLV